MPGQLKSDAACPVCDMQIYALVDETGDMGKVQVIRKFYHQKIAKKVRRRRCCVVGYTDRAEAARERTKLEV